MSDTTRPARLRLNRPVGLVRSPWSACTRCSPPRPIPGTPAAGGARRGSLGFHRSAAHDSAPRCDSPRGSLDDSLLSVTSLAAPPPTHSFSSPANRTHLVSERRTRGHKGRTCHLWSRNRHLYCFAWEPPTRR